MHCPFDMKPWFTMIRGLGPWNYEWPETMDGEVSVTHMVQCPKGKRYKEHVIIILVIEGEGHSKGLHMINNVDAMQ